MIGMPIVPVRQRDRARPALPDQPDDVGDLRVGAGDAAVGPAQVDAPGGAEHLAGVFGFAPRARPACRSIPARRASGRRARRDRRAPHARPRFRQGRSRCRRDAGRRRGGRRDRRASNPKLQSPNPKALPTANFQLTPNQLPNGRWESGCWRLNGMRPARSRNCPDKAHDPTDRNPEHGDPDLPTARCRTAPARQYIARTLV